MQNVARLKFLIPFIILFVLLGLLWRELFYAKPNELPSALIGENLPGFKLPDLYANQRLFTPNDLRGKVSLLNVWATWCYACGLEHEMLMQIKDKYHVPLYSIDYKDNPDTAKSWLKTKGNPYKLIGNDENGDVGIDLGVYGTPETFVISREGKIVYRHIGAIDQKTWDEVLYPLVLKYERAT